MKEERKMKFLTGPAGAKAFDQALKNLSQTDLEGLMRDMELQQAVHDGKMYKRRKLK